MPINLSGNTKKNATRSTYLSVTNLLMGDLDTPPEPDETTDEISTY